MATCECTTAVEAGAVLRALARRRRVVVAVVELERGYDVPPGGQARGRERQQEAVARRVEVGNVGMPKHRPGPL